MFNRKLAVRMSIIQVDEEQSGSTNGLGEVVTESLDTNAVIRVSKDSGRTILSRSHKTVEPRNAKNKVKYVR